jgi:tetratricopeptide (TPR) repeat protein
MLVDFMKMGSDEWQRRAEQLFRQGDFKAALSAAQEAARLRPGSAYLHRLLGYLHAALGEHREARAEFERAAILDPKLRVNLADFYLAQALNELETQLRMNPADPEVARRVRAVAALAEVQPELKNLLRATQSTSRAEKQVQLVPPLLLSEQAPYALVVEKRTQTARLYHWQQGTLEIERTYPVTTGQASGEKQRRGDLRTPDGVYTVVDLIPGEQLPDLYGAFALPLNYPNAWDRQQGRNGHGIWIHGSDRLTQPLRPRETRGCVVLRGEDLLTLVQLVRPQLTPVIIAETIPFQSPESWQKALGPLFEQARTPGVAALAAGPEYAALFRQADDKVLYEYRALQAPYAELAREEIAQADSNAWREKVAAVLPREFASLERVRVRNDSRLPRLIIETSAPARPRALRPDSKEALYLDFPGVRPGPVPETLAGDGKWIRQVRIAASQIEPPITRLVVELNQPSNYRLSTSGKETVVYLTGR